MDHNEKWALITGTNRGIGYSIAKRLAKDGFHILAHAREKSEQHDELLESIIKDYHVKAEPVYFDMTEYELMKKNMQDLYKSKKQLSVLVNNAGIAHGGYLQMTPLRKIREVFDVNYFAVVELTQLAVKIMMQQRQGSIINIASISGLDLQAGNCAYGTSKAALIAFTKTISSELVPYGIRVNAVAPGLTDTDMAGKMEEKAGRTMMDESATGRMAKTEEIASLVSFLSSDESGFINGQVIRIDGGKK